MMVIWARGWKGWGRINPVQQRWRQLMFQGYMNLLLFFFIQSVNSIACAATKMAPFKNDSLWIIFYAEEERW